MTEERAQLIEGALRNIKDVFEERYRPNSAAIDVRNNVVDKNELEFRRESRSDFDAWLNSRDEKIDVAQVEKLVKGLTLFNYEDQDLRYCVLHPENLSLVQELRERLDDARKEYDPEGALAKVVDVISRMEKTVRERPQDKPKLTKSKVKKQELTKQGIKTKWTVPTALLSTASEKYPFIRPSSTGHKPGMIRDVIFEGIPWASKVDTARYVEYCERYKLVCDAMKTVGISSDTPSPADASAWMVSAQYVLDGHRAMEELQKLVEHGPTILHGPPGTGKTYSAERLAEYMAQDDKAAGIPRDELAVISADRFDLKKRSGVRVVTELVQFHASYDYEDFVRGFRPVVSGQSMAFELQDGPFARMVSYALRFPEIKFLLIVDEINRADLSRVLGECIYLLDRWVPQKEVDDVWKGSKPGAAALRYSPSEPVERSEYDPTRGKLLAKLCVPDNFFLVGTMNTADRSIAIVDVALRRRFKFRELRPDPDVVQTSSDSTPKNKKTYQEWMGRLNGHEGGEPALISDSRYHIGHSYFLGTDEKVRVRIDFQLLPLLEEYKRDRRFSASDADVESFMNDLRKHAKDE